MADSNENVGGFALGLIVAAILFLFLRREIGMHAATAEAGGGAGGGKSANGGGVGAGGGGGCGCGGGGTGKISVIPLGGQSYNEEASYSASSVVSGSNKNSIPQWLESA